MSAEFSHVASRNVVAQLFRGGRNIGGSEFFKNGFGTENRGIAAQGEGNPVGRGTLYELRRSFRLHIEARLKSAVGEIVDDHAIKAGVEAFEDDLDKVDGLRAFRLHVEGFHGDRIGLHGIDGNHERTGSDQLSEDDDRSVGGWIYCKRDYFEQYKHREGI